MMYDTLLCYMNHAGGQVIHSYGRLIPHEFPITDLQQISDPDGIGRISCTDSSGTPSFFRPGIKSLETGGVTQTNDGNTATLTVNPNGIFENRDIVCKSTYLYLFILSGNRKFAVAIEHIIYLSINTLKMVNLHWQNGTTNCLIIYLTPLHFLLLCSN